MTLAAVLQELEAYGNPQTKKTLMNHGAPEPIWGVKVGDMKKIIKKIKKDHELSLALYATGNSDAMYMAGLIADEKQITKTTLQQWAKQATYAMITEWTVPWVASETDHGPSLADKWIDSKDEKIATTGWATWSSILTVTPDEALDKDHLTKLLLRVEKEIHQSPNRVRHVMNAFVIAVGSSVPSLTKLAKSTAAKIGKVEVNMNGTACKVPDAITYIEKVEKAGRLGRKKKTARC